MLTRRALISRRILSFISVFPEQGGRMFHVERPLALLYVWPSPRLDVPRGTCSRLSCRRAARASPCTRVLVPPYMPCWACVEAGKGRFVRVLVAWPLCGGWGLLALGATLVDVIDATQHAARRTRHSWPLVFPREVTALPRSAEGYPSAL